MSKGCQNLQITRNLIINLLPVTLCASPVMLKVLLYAHVRCKHVLCVYNTIGFLPRVQSIWSAWILTHHLYPPPDWWKLHRPRADLGPVTMETFATWAELKKQGSGLKRQQLYIMQEAMQMWYPCLRSSYVYRVWLCSCTNKQKIKSYTKILRNSQLYDSKQAHSSHFTKRKDFMKLPVTLR